MKIFGNGKKFELNVLGYQFVEFDNYYDANWLNIQVKAADDVSEWQAQDSCLLSYELPELREWFSNILKTDGSEDLTIDFMERELAFRYDGNERTLSVILNFNLHPKGENYIYGEDGDSEYVVDLLITHKQLKGLITDLDTMTKNFPVRGEELDHSA